MEKKWDTVMPADLKRLFVSALCKCYFAGKCILTGSTEWRYFKVDGSMEKKWDNVIPADLKRLFVSAVSRENAF